VPLFMLKYQVNWSISWWSADTFWPIFAIGRLIENQAFGDRTPLTFGRLLVLLWVSKFYLQINLSIIKMLSHPFDPPHPYAPAMSIIVRKALMDIVFSVT